MLIPKIKLLILYIVIIVAMLLAVSMAKLNSFAKVLNVGVIDIFTPTPAEITKDGSINILFLGVGGEGHEGPFLTDSITFIRYTPSSNTITTLGLPRDIWDPEIQDKINSIYTYGMQQQTTDKFSYTKRKFQELFGVNFDYIAVVDFGDFEKLIDLLGGITVHLDKGFIDPMYPKEGSENEVCVPFDPDYGCRYQTLVFRAGDLNLNGSVALKFVRSRHAQGSEGSDFSRNIRQQIVINAVKTKIMTLIQQRDFDGLYNITVFLNNQIGRDISNKEALPIVRTIISRLNTLKIISNTIGNDLLETPPMDKYEGRYVLIPINNDYNNFKQIVENYLNQRKY